MNLAQYYTADIYSDLLVSYFKSSEVSRILDIGCGQAGLLNAASKRWNEAKLIGYDIDPLNYSINCNRLKLQYGNGFDPELSNKILDTFGKIDISVSNPPYLNISVNSDVQTILKKSGLNEAISNKLTIIPAELVFIAQNLLVLKRGGELGIILPASIINGEKWKSVREYILSNYTVSNCVQLPVNAFKRTETSTFAVCLSNYKSKNSQKINLQSYLVEKSIVIDEKRAVNRMDFSYYNLKSNKVAVNDRDLIRYMFRGNKTEKDLINSSYKYLHTSDLKDVYQELDLSYDHSYGGSKYASAGDFVFSRVGSRCVGKCAYIKNGRMSISDCLFVVKLKNVEQFIKYLKSGVFYEVTRGSSLGVGAKYITMGLLKEMINGSSV